MEHWNKIYADGDQINRWPFQHLVQYLYTNYSNLKDINLLEIGCGVGNNFLVYDDMNFKYTGLDLSELACESASCLASKLANKGEVIHTNFLDFQTNNKYDIIVDRGSLGMNNWVDALEIVQKAKRSLRENGKYLVFDLNGKSSTDFLYAKEISKNYYIGNQGSLLRNKKMMFLNEENIQELLNAFNCLSINKHTTIENIKKPVINEYYDVFCSI